jgi:hypothetical protein
MKKIFTLLLAITASALLISLSSCNCKHGSGHLITEVRNIGNFSSIDIAGGYRVVVKQDSTVSSVTLTADDNLMQYIKTDIDGERLKIHSTHRICSSGQYLITIRTKNLSYFKASGAIEVASEGKITAKDIEFNLSGATKITLDLNADNVKTECSGLTELNLTGQAKTHNVNMSGSGTLNALNFVAGSYNIKTSGMSHCKINVLNDLNVNSSGVSEIQYRGNPANVNNNKSGISSLKKID